MRVEVTISVSGITLRLHIEEECFLSNPEQFAYDDAVKTLFVKGFLRTDKSSSINTVFETIYHEGKNIIRSLTNVDKR